MARILVGYERGDNLGHYRRLAPVAQALAAQGHEVTFFLRNPYDCRMELTRSSLPFLQSPDLVPPNPAERGPKRMGSYSDIMVYCGFGKVETLFPGVLSWHTLFDRLRPDLIVCDHSPVLCHAAYGRIPVIQVGDGFTIPPAGADSFPGFTPKKQAFVPVEEILGVMNDVQRRVGGPEMPCITAPLRTAGRLICTLVGLDPYKDLRRDPVVGPTEGLQKPMPMPKAPRIFAYLGMEHRITAKLLAALKDSDIPAEAYVRGLTAETAQKFVRPGIVFYKSPQPMDQMLARASLVIHHGGSGMCLACFSAGRPQIALPIHEETLLNTQALRRTGTGRALSAKELEEGGGAKLAEAEGDPRLRERAAFIAREIAGVGPFRPMDRILEACRAALA